jgi:hypothetical protein
MRVALQQPVQIEQRRQFMHPGLMRSAGHFLIFRPKAMLPKTVMCLNKA